MDQVSESAVAVSPLGVAETPQSPRDAVNAMVEAGLFDQLFEQIDDGGLQLTGEGGFLPEMIKAVLERGLQAELTEHLGYDKGDPAGRGSPNSRNGFTPKTLASEVGQVPRGLAAAARLVEHQGKGLTGHGLPFSSTSSQVTQPTPTTTIAVTSIPSSMYLPNRWVRGETSRNSGSTRSTSTNRNASCAVRSPNTQVMSAANAAGTSAT